MAAEVNRLASGGRIDRTRRLRFRFDGRDYTGHAGDTLASALLANGVTLAARSFKYHRPRGFVGAWSEDPGVLVELEGEAAGGNCLPTTLPLTDGLSARPVHCWPSLAFDLGTVNELISRLIPAGFYYKTFKWPGWHLYEPAIRRAAGLAAAPAAPPPRGRFESVNAHADVLIAGAGPAGLMAALVAGRSGARVMLVDDGTEAGGSLLARRVTIGGAPAADWVASAVADLAAMPNVTHLQRATVWAYREHNLLMVQEHAPADPGILQRSWRVRAGRVICASGAIERILVFAGNDRPGVMLASAAQAFVNRYAVRPGRRAVVFTNNDSAYEVASDIQAAGVEVAAIVDSRPSVPEHARARVPQVTILAGSVVQETVGRSRVRAALVRPVAGGALRRIDCDIVAMSGGWNPTLHLHSQSRGTLGYDAALAAFVPAAAAQPCVSTGAAAGRFGLATGLTDGAVAAAAALAGLGRECPDVAVPAAVDEPYAIEPLWSVPPRRPGDKAFVDIRNDVTLADLELAHREGYGAIEHAKRYTTGGMGIDQGKTGNAGIIGIMAGLQGVGPGEVGTMTYRSPYTPVEFGAIAGGRAGPVVLPYRHTPLTEWHRAQGAVMYEAGARWRRPGYYPRPGEGFQEAVDREARAVREGVGIYDGAPLGTYDISGPDAARFLDHIYTSRFRDLGPGQGRYGLMLTEDGLILDDGVSFRLGTQRYLMSTSTANADAVLQHMEKVLQIDRPEWRVRITNLTSQWTNATICGPKARDVLAALGTDIDIGPQAFPFMSLRDGHVAGLPARVIRVSFTGELSFEINVRPRDLPALWDRILSAGAPFGIMPIGSEANHVLRVEKGFLSLGHEVDGTTDAYDLGMGWAMAKSKGDFIGRRSVALRRAGPSVRRELVGVLPVDPECRIPEGAPLTEGGRRTRSEGLVTACVRSVVLGRWIGLALLERGRARLGQRAHVRLPDRVIGVTVTRPVFHDPDGLRMRS